MSNKITNGEFEKVFNDFFDAVEPNYEAQHHLEKLTELRRQVRTACELLDLAYGRGGLNADGVMAWGMLEKAMQQ